MTEKTEPPKYSLMLDALRVAKHAACAEGVSFLLWRSHAREWEPAEWQVTRYGTNIEGALLVHRVYPVRNRRRTSNELALARRKARGK